MHAAASQQIERTRLGPQVPGEGLRNAGVSCNSEEAKPACPEPLQQKPHG
jgi:hypothetical protein